MSWSWNMTKNTAIPGSAKSKKSTLRVPNPKSRLFMTPKTPTWTVAAPTAKITPRERSIIFPLARSRGRVCPIIGVPSLDEPVGPGGDQEQQDHPRRGDGELGAEVGKRSSLDDDAPHR